MGVESGVDAGSGRDADGELMAIVLRDFITFPFNGGRGLRTNQLAGEINRSQLHKDVGMPTYGGTTTYDAGTATRSMAAHLAARHECGASAAVVAVPAVSQRD